MITITKDIELSIATGLSAQAKKWTNVSIKWSELVEKLSKTIYTSETYEEYMAMPKSEQAKIKDVGGYVGGYLEKGSRKKGSVRMRQLICLDLDFSNEDIWTDFILMYNFAALIHGTHKHCKSNPRHRILIPLSRPINADEYQAVSRWIANTIDINLFDQSTFDVNRLMFWPSTPRDCEYYFDYQDGEILDPDTILNEYTNWRNTSEWPVANGAASETLRLKKTQEDPESKEGVIGAFCRTYNIHDVIAKFLPDIYEQVDDTRYTYLLGSTVGGLITYDDKFAYSHHGTDPAGGTLCSSFDLVRIHKFGELDDDLNSKKSLYAMEDFARSDDAVRSEIARERLEETRAAFGLDYIDYIDAVEGDEQEENIEWMANLELDKKGGYLNSANNLNIILKEDKYLKNAFVLNTFDNKRYVQKTLPWRRVDGLDYIKDCDYAGIRNYIECVYGIVNVGKIDDALSLVFEKQKIHPIVQYLESLEWDGNPRVETLMIDYFGADDNAYTRQAITKMLVGAVARVKNPGVKFDTALIIVGPQGCYKSTFIKKLGKGWSSDTFMSVQGKESFEQLQGCWLIEIAELAGIKKAEVEAIKHYLSKTDDSFRPAYGRVVETYRRQCVFFGTTNTANFLRDETGNRRFLPVDVNLDRVTKSVLKDLTDDEIDQIWAEAYDRYVNGEDLYLDEAAVQGAISAQKEHCEVDDRQGVIEDFLNMKFPKNYNKWSIFERCQWLENPVRTEGDNYKKSFCIAELWCECLGKNKADLTKSQSKELKNIIANLPDWESAIGSKDFHCYGRQRYFRRIGSNNDEN